MRRCARAEEVRRALAEDELLSGELATHAATCSECARISAAARRFHARLDAATAELVTDSLPANTPMAARMAPSATGRRSSPGVLLSAIASTALVAFAAVGIVVAGVSLTDALQGGAGAREAAGQDLDPVDCYLGDPTVNVAAGNDGVSAVPGAVIAYCFGVVEAGVDDRARAISCARATSSMAAHRRAREAWETASPAASGDPAYLGACTMVVDVEVTHEEPADEASVPSVPLASWENADEETDWSVFRPGWLPDGYDLAALQGFGTPADLGTVSSVVATYLRSGSPLTIEQFAIADPDAFRIELSIPGDQLRDVSTGRTTVDGHPAFWADGVVVTASGPGQDIDALVLTWTNGATGYRITSRTEDLESVRRIGGSLTGE